MDKRMTVELRQLHREYPRLTAVGIGGMGLLLVSLLIAAADASVKTSFGNWAFRIGFLGVILLIFSISGYISIKIFETHPHNRE
ncbi:MAG: hypothetical protein ABEI52_02495 [Halobacteriaceae archaeon]